MTLNTLLNRYNKTIKRECNEAVIYFGKVSAEGSLSRSVQLHSADQDAAMQTVLTAIHWTEQSKKYHFGVCLNGWETVLLEIQSQASLL